jgi:hypothetical protein
MALPIKPSDTQEGCNPISSNCVIWQGPDIPCIQLCTGDSVSDVVAKMAERLCTISDQLDISLLDLSCFNPIAPTPKDFRDVMQLIINKVCGLENPVVDPDSTSKSTCPDDCIVTIAACFQETDFLGNLITTLPLKDYVIKIGNELCTIISQITTINGTLTNMQAQIDALQTCCDAPNDINITTSGCIGRGITQSVQSFLISLESAYCELAGYVGTPSDLSSSLTQVCITSSDIRLSSPPLTFSTLTPNWILNPANLAQSVGNLWIALCDLRTAYESYVSTTDATLASLQSQLDACCGITCASLLLSGSSSFTSKFIYITFSGGPLPSGWNFCSTDYTVTGSSGTSVNLTAIPGSGVGEIHYPTWQTIDLSTPAYTNTYNSLYYQVTIDICLTDGTSTCNQTLVLPAIAGEINSCPTITLSAPTGTTIQADWTNPYSALNITWTMYLVEVNTSTNYTYAWSNPSTGANSHTFTALPAGDYQAYFIITQGTSAIYSKSCQGSPSSIITIP